MSVESVLAAVGNDLKGFAAKVAADVTKAKQAWAVISSPQVRSILIGLGQDAVKLVRDGAVAADGKGLQLDLDAAVVADIKQLIADAKAGDGVILSDLRVLGHTF